MSNKVEKMLTCFVEPARGTWINTALISLLTTKHTVNVHLKKVDFYYNIYLRKKQAL